MEFNVWNINGKTYVVVGDAKMNHSCLHDWRQAVDQNLGKADMQYISDVDQALALIAKQDYILIK